MRELVNTFAFRHARSEIKNTFNKATLEIDFSD